MPYTSTGAPTYKYQVDIQSTGIGELPEIPGVYLNTRMVDTNTTLHITFFDAHQALRVIAQLQRLPFMGKAEVTIYTWQAS